MNPEIDNFLELFSDESAVPAKEFKESLKKRVVRKYNNKGFWSDLFSSALWRFSTATGVLFVALIVLTVVIVPSVNKPSIFVSNLAATEKKEILEKYVAQAPLELNELKPAEAEPQTIAPSEVKEKIERLNLYLTQKVSKKSKVITPPDSLEQTIRPAEEGQKLEEMRIFPRLLTLMYILEHDFEIEPEEVSIIEGEVTPEMMRKSPYYRVKIDGLNRIVYICDEEGNASYVFDLEIIKENNLDIDEIDLDSKEARNALIAKYPGIGIRIIQSKNWRHNISEMLENPLPQNDSEESAGSQKSRESEFKREKRKYLPFEDFQKEVREFYPGGIGVVQWYLTEYKKHEGWPASPEKTYEGKGWEGHSKLVGKEKRKRKGELLPFEEFRGEVIRAYPGKVGVLRWYKREQKNHKNWPSEPTRTYKDNWIGWPELVGIENRLKREFLSFENFKDAVRSAYPGDRNVQNWYMTEYKNHKGWPANPQRTYKNNWVGWSELVDKAK